MHMHMHVDHTRNQDTRSRTAVTPVHPTRASLAPRERRDGGPPATLQQPPLRLGRGTHPRRRLESPPDSRARKVSERNRLLAGRLSCRPPRLAAQTRARSSGGLGISVTVFAFVRPIHDVRGSGARGVGSLHSAGRRRVRGRYN